MSEVDVSGAVAKVLGRIAPEADLGAVAPDEDLREALDIDSFDFLNFVIGLNQELGVEIPEADYGQLTTVAGITRYLEARRS